MSEGHKRSWGSISGQLTGSTFSCYISLGIGESAVRYHCICTCSREGDYCWLQIQQLCRDERAPCGASCVSKEDLDSIVPLAKSLASLKMPCVWQVCSVWSVCRPLSWGWASCFLSCMLIPPRVLRVSWKTTSCEWAIPVMIAINLESSAMSTIESLVCRLENHVSRNWCAGFTVKQLWECWGLWMQISMLRCTHTTDGPSKVHQRFLQGL